MRNRSALKISGVAGVVCASLAAVVLIIGCNQFNLYNRFSPSPLAISPATAAVQVSGTVTFSATGGDPPYSFSVVAGGGTVGATSGVYTAPGAAGTAAVSVLDSQGKTSVASITVSWPASSPLVISPSVAAVGAGGTISFGASGGVPPYTYSKAAGGGSISGSTYTAPLTAGSAAVSVRDTAGSVSTASITVAAPPPLTISPTSLTIGGGGTYQFAASGGVVGTYTFTLYSGIGSATAGGLYTAPATSGTADVRVTDGAGSTADASVQVVTSGSLAISPASPSVPEGKSVTFVGSGGTPAYTFSLASGVGSVTGGVYTAPTGTVGTSVASVSVTDSVLASVSTAITILPDAPSSLTATVAAGPQIQLSWMNNTSAATGVDVYRQTGGSGGFSLLTTLSATSTSYSDSSITAGTLYTYYVCAVSGAVSSLESNRAYGIP